jgi:hypothetical protein
VAFSCTFFERRLDEQRNQTVHGIGSSAPFERDPVGAPDPGTTLVTGKTRRCCWPGRIVRDGRLAVVKLLGPLPVAISRGGTLMAPHVILRLAPRRRSATADAPRSCHPDLRGHLDLHLGHTGSSRTSQFRNGREDRRPDHLREAAFATEHKSCTRPFYA